MKRQSCTTRRQFLKAAGVAVAAPFVITLFAEGQPRTPANDRIVMATIGTGGQGTGDMQRVPGLSRGSNGGGVRPVPEHREKARSIVNGRYKNSDCKAYSDFREVVARDDIDAVLIATPDHWHALITIAACKHGKDVYCEKPETLTIREGRAMVEAVRRYGRVFSGGSQRVLDDYRNPNVHKLLWGGTIGKVQEEICRLRWPVGRLLPASATGSRWAGLGHVVGPAPWRPYHSTLIRGRFRAYRDFSGGGMTDWGAHRFGAAMFATQTYKTGPVEVIPPDGKDHKYLTYIFADGMKMYHGGTNDITYKGSEGTLPGIQHKEPAAVDVPGYRSRNGIFGDFLACVRSRQRPFRDIEIAHRTCTVCHLGNIAYWLNRLLKWDPVKEVIIGDEEANRWVDRPKREPWTL